MTETTTQQSKTAREEHTAIRAAFKKGKKTITLRGVELSITRKDTQPVVVVGGVQRKLKESWLIVAPVSKGTRTPVFNIPLEEGGNSRVKAN